MSKSIRAILGVAMIAGTAVAASLPADAAPRNHQQQSRAYSPDAGQSYVPEGEFAGYPDWARSAFAPKS